MFRDLTFEQTLTYGQKAAARIGARVEFVVLERSGKPAAAACIRIKTVPMLGRGIAWIASGPMVQLHGQPDPSQEDIREILGALRAYVCGSKGHILRLRFPAIARHDSADVTRLLASEGFGHTEMAASYQTVIIDISCGEAVLMRQLHGKWRNALRNAIKAEMELVRGPISALSDRFHVLYQQVQLAKGFQPAIPPEFFYTLEGPDFAHEVLIARKDGVDVAGITIGRGGNSSVYLFGATTDPGRRLNAGNFLIWQGVLSGIEQGLNWFDLGGIDADANPDVTRFKRRMGGIEIEAAGPFEIRPSGPVPIFINVAEMLKTRLKKWGL